LYSTRRFTVLVSTGTCTDRNKNRYCTDLELIAVQNPIVYKIVMYQKSTYDKLSLEYIKISLQQYRHDKFDIYTCTSWATTTARATAALVNDPYL
jgi:hypothetical protein